MRLRMRLVVAVFAASACAGAWQAAHTHPYDGPGNAGVYTDLGGGYCVGVEVRGQLGPFGWLPPGVGDPAACR